MDGDVIVGIATFDARVFDTFRSLDRCVYLYISLLFSGHRWDLLGGALACGIPLTENLW
jgi:hypothetical protein